MRHSPETLNAQWKDTEFRTRTWFWQRELTTSIGRFAWTAFCSEPGWKYIAFACFGNKYLLNSLHMCIHKSQHFSVLHFKNIQKSNNFAGSCPKLAVHIFARSGHVCVLMCYMCVVSRIAVGPSRTKASIFFIFFVLRVPSDQTKVDPT